MISAAALMTFISQFLSPLFATTHHPTRSSTPSSGSASLAALWDADSTTLDPSATSTTILTSLAWSMGAASAAVIRPRTLMGEAPRLSSKIYLLEASIL